MHPSILLRFGCGCVLLLWGLTITTMGFAADYTLVPQLLFDGNYNSNVFFDSDEDDPQDDYIYMIAPGLLWRRHSEQLLSELFAQGRFFRYQDLEDLDKTDQLYRGKVDFTATEHMTVGASGSYIVDNQIDRDIDATGLLLGTAERQRQKYRGFGNLLVAERTNLNLSGGYSQDRFDQEEFWNNWGADAALGLNHQLKTWPNTTLQGQLTYRHFAFDRDQTSNAGNIETRVEEDNTTDNFALTIGAENRKTERLILVFSGGARYTLQESENHIRQRLQIGEGEYLDIGVESSDNNDEAWGFVGNASLAYRGERNEVSLGVSHDIKPLSGSGDTAQRTSLTGTWWFQMTTEWRFNAAASYYWNRSDDNGSSAQDVDTTTFTASPRVRYAFTRDLYMEGQYRYTRVEDREDEETNQRHLASVSLFIKHDLLD
jgi:hypothetical protein